MGKTHFSDIDLSNRGIEAREINSETATSSQYLAANGTGGASWQQPLVLVQDPPTSLAAVPIIVTREEVSPDNQWSTVSLSGHLGGRQAKLALCHITMTEDDSIGGATFTFSPGTLNIFALAVKVRAGGSTSCVVAIPLINNAFGVNLAGSPNALITLEVRLVAAL